MQELWDKFLEIFKPIWESGKGDFYGGALLAILGAVIWFFRRQFSNFLRSVTLFRTQAVIIPTALLHYKQSLDQSTHRIAHSWKLEGQSLKDIFVPINTRYLDHSRKRVPLAEVIRTHFAQHPTWSPISQRLILIGDAGSGKSVAMGCIAREAWYVQRRFPVTPVLLSFSEIKHVKSEAELEKVIVSVLERNQFEKSKRSGRAELYVTENLYRGNILLLLDGFDELEKSIRFEISRFLNTFFRTYPAVPFVLSSRTAVWKQNPNVFDELNCSVLEVADFTPNDIRIFTSQWQFEGNKSGERLAELINSKIYLRSIAVNPLMLTIISFLYAQPKRILPDNRVKFYSECIDALLEKWDFSKSIDRANKFETIDKRTILSELAYTHIVNTGSSDEEIKKEVVLNTVTEVMRNLSRPVEKRELLINEIVHNAELLIQLPPDGYMFPHRTFMEFFAANHFFEQGNGEELLGFYLSDKGRWEETLLLFCGLNTNPQTSDAILNRLLQEFKQSTSQDNPDKLIFRALVESARVNPALAGEVLTQANGYLQGKLDRDIIENLGYIAMNPAWEHSKQAKAILSALLEQPSSDQEVQAALLALTVLQDKDLQERVLQQADKINLTDFLIRLGEESEEYAIQLLQKIGKDKHPEIFKGLKEAGRSKFIIRYILESKDLETQVIAILALFRSTNGIFDLYDEFNAVTLTDELEAEYPQVFSGIFRRLKWHRMPELNAEGQRFLWWCCYLMAEGYAQAGLPKVKDADEIDNRIRYLISVLLGEKGIDFYQSPFFPSYLLTNKFSRLNCWNFSYQISFDLKGLALVSLLVMVILNLASLLLNEHSSLEIVILSFPIFSVFFLLSFFGLKSYNLNFYEKNIGLIENVCRFLAAMMAPVCFPLYLIGVFPISERNYLPFFRVSIFLLLVVIITFPFLFTFLLGISPGHRLFIIFVNFFLTVSIVPSYVNYCPICFIDMETQGFINNLGKK